MKIRMSPNLLRLIETHGEESYPSEGAGVLLGKMTATSVQIEEILPMENQFEADMRSRRYRIDAEAMMRSEYVAEEKGLVLLGIFHSHPDHPARPSAYDLEHSLPWYTYIITSVEAGVVKESRAWRLLDDRSAFEELELSVNVSEGHS